MKRLAVFLLLTILGIAALAWLLEAAVAGSTGPNAGVILLVWGLGGACLAMALIAFRLWRNGRRLEAVLRQQRREPADTCEPAQPTQGREQSVEEALRRSAGRAEALVRTAARLNEHIEQQALLDTICEEAARVLDVPVATISLFDPKQAQFRLAASVGLPAEFAQRALPLSWFRQQAGEARQPFIVRDLQAVEQSALSRMLLQFELRTVVFVELHYHERLLGLLLVSVVGEPRDLDAEDLNLMSGLAEQAAQAITKANLFKALQRLLRRTQRQSRQMQRIMDAVPDGLLLLGHERRVLLANPAGRLALARLAPDYDEDGPLQQLGGRDMDALLAECGDEETWVELHPPSEAPTLEENEPTAARVFEMTARPIEDNGPEGAWIAVIRDVTAERQQRLGAQSQDRLATVGQLAAGIAHDFNNIMAVIMLYSQSLERNPDFPKRREYLATISAQAQQASTLISQILDFSRSAVVARGRLDLLPFVKETVKLLQRTLPENIGIRLQADRGKYEVSGDPTQLQQAMMNLALNARDAMPQGGELLISLKMLDLQVGERGPLRGMAPGRYMCLSVADNGEGIAPEARAHLFEPYFSTKGPSTGTGMGLAQVYGIVKQHGGEIEVDSSVGRGARFTLYLPALETETPPERDGEGWESLSGGSATILLVEDHEPTREAIGDTLELLGYDVLVTSTGREALRLFEAQGQAVDLVLSDMVMPEMGGVELYRELMARNPNLKMIVMTGYPLENEGRTLLEEGIVEWIRKPFSPDALGERIERVLER